MVYYNEFDPKAAAWLRELIKCGAVPDGVVDERDIQDIFPNELEGYKQCHFFAGISGWAFALRLAGWPDDKPVWTGSCPCQPFSAAGKGAGVADERHLWPAFKWLIEQCGPPVVFGEQIASSLGREWLAGVRVDLEGMGYDVGAADLCAAGVGAPHIRQRLYWVADAKNSNWRSGVGGAKEGVGENGEWRRGFTVGGCDGGLVLPNSAGRNTGKPSSKTTRHGNSTESAGGAVGGGDSDGAGPQGRVIPELPECSGEQAPREGGASCGMAHAGYDERRPEFGVTLQECDSRFGKSGAWSNYELTQCLDGKSRRVESQPAKMDDGLSGILDALRSAGASETQIETALSTSPLAKDFPGRVMLLRGYGNAIVPHLAAKFIRAFRQPLP